MLRVVPPVERDTNPAPASDPAPDTGLLCLALVAKTLGIAVDPARLRHEQGGTEPSDIVDVLRAAKGLGLKARGAKVGWKGLTRLHPPAILALKDGSFRVFVRIVGHQALVLDPTSGAPETLTQYRLSTIWAGTAILCAARAAPAEESRKFGVGWIFSAAGRHRKLFGEAILASFVLQLFALGSPLLFQVVIDKVIVHRGMTTLDVMAIALGALALFEIALTLGRGYVLTHTTTRVDVELGARAFRHLLGLPMSYFESRRVGDTVQRLKELETVRGFLSGSVPTVGLDALFAVVFLGVMWIYSPTLTLIVIAAIPVYAAISIGITPLLKSRLDERASRSAETQSMAVEALSGIETIKSMAVEPALLRRYEEQLAEATRASFAAQQINAVGSNLVNLASKLVTVALLWIGAKMVIDGSLSVGQLVAFNMLAGRVATPILRLSQLWQEMQQMRVAVKRVADIMDRRVESAGGGGTRGEAPPLEGEVRLESVRFRYRPDGPEVLNDVSLDVRAGEIVGVTGPSGSGKSTLAKLVQRLHVPERGRVLIDGNDAAGLDPAWLRRQTGIVLQDNVLFSRSVRENIALADPAMAAGRVEWAAKLAGAHEFILQLPQGYDTQVGERGATLSGGQRQRLALARALAVDPKILILDEATSSLDSESERIIHANLREICRGRTAIVIAHRLSTLRLADWIAVMDKGRIVEIGTHDDLVAKGGPYAKLHRLQAGGVGNAD
jgi:ATP-binding cassette, subfamily B, bacterial HlyB/CyaB